MSQSSVRESISAGRGMCTPEMRRQTPNPPIWRVLKVPSLWLVGTSMVRDPRSPKQQLSFHQGKG